MYKRSKQVSRAGMRFLMVTGAGGTIIINCIVLGEFSAEEVGI